MEWPDEHAFHELLVLLSPLLADFNFLFFQKI